MQDGGAAQAVDVRLTGREPGASPALVSGLIAALLAAIVALVAGGAQDGAPSAAAEREASELGGLPLAFEPDADRYAPGIDYVARTGAGPVTIGERGIGLPARGPGGRTEIRMTPSGGELSVATPSDRLPGVVNDLRGRNSDHWRSSIPTYAGVGYADVWPGIDIDLYGAESLLRYDFRVAPGADPSAIGLDFGAASTRIGPGGNLIVQRDGATIRQSAPVSFQMAADGTRDPVDSRFEIRPDGSVGIVLGAYDASRELVIDPLVLGYSTFLGGFEDDVANGVAVGPDGSTYLTGFTTSDDFPGAAGQSAGDDAFVAKLAPDGTALEWSTYIGGAENDAANGIAVDEAGSAYVAGETLSADFPVVGPIRGDNGEQDAFALKLAPDGGSLLYSTYLSGSNGDAANAIAIDPTGAAYVSGATSSPDFPTRNSIYPKDDGEDAFITKLAPSGGAILYGTYMGGGSADSANGIAVDAAGAAYVAGSTASRDFPTDAPLEGNRGGVDAFVAKLNLAGSGVSWSTYIGGGQDDSANAIAVSDEGETFVAGDTSSANLTLVDAFQTDQGGQDGFVVKLGDGAPELEFSTYLGGSGDDYANAIVVDDRGRAHVGGLTGSADFPAIDQIGSGSSGDDGFVTRFGGGGSEPDFSSLIGGESRDIVQALAVDDAGRVYAAGVSRSADFPLRNAIQSAPVNPEFWDAFALRLDVATDTTIDSGPADGSAIATRDAEFTFSASEPGATFECSLNDGEFTACDSPFSLTGLAEGDYVLRVRGVVAGLVDETPASRAFEVDTTAPDTTIDDGPEQGATLTVAAPEFEFSSDESDADFECRFDDEQFEDCASPFTESLSDGEHRFEVRAVDRAGNRDASPATRDFVVDAVDTDPPETTIIRAPKKVIKTRKRKVAVRFRFGSDEPGRFECSWNRSPFNRCPSPARFKLGRGKHRLVVRAVDSAGNPDPTPKRRLVIVRRKRR